MLYRQHHATHLLQSATLLCSLLNTAIPIFRCFSVLCSSSGAPSVQQTQICTALKDQPVLLQQTGICKVTCAVCLQIEVLQEVDLQLVARAASLLYWNCALANLPACTCSVAGNAVTYSKQ